MSPGTPPGTPANRLAGRRILIVEDGYHVAEHLARTLVALDATVAGPAGDLVTALVLARSAPLDAALLDVDLAGDRSFPVADVLAGRAIPYLFLTGYDDSVLPERFRSTRRLAKPVSMARVVDELAGLFASENLR